MGVSKETPNYLINKLGALILIILGFLVGTAGYRNGSSVYIVAGIIFLAVGFALLIRKIMRRNQIS